MIMIVSAAARGAQGFDTDTALTPSSAGALTTTGFRFAVRYLSRAIPQAPGDLSVEEARTILGSGLALMAVQHCQRPGWLPSQALGEQYGATAEFNAQAIGLPPGVTLWLDLEGIAPYASAAETIAYVNAWTSQVAGAGYQAGLYVGANQPLNGDELYWRLKVTRYWRSASTVPDIPYRGYCMAQALAPSPIDGISVDRNVVMADAFGGLPMWAASGSTS
jgi:hypothetical protein